VSTQCEDAERFKRDTMAGRDEAATVFSRRDAFVTGRKMVSWTRPVGGREKRVRGGGGEVAALDRVQRAVALGADGPTHVVFQEERKLISACGRATCCARGRAARESVFCFFGWGRNKARAENSNSTGLAHARSKRGVNGPMRVRTSWWSVARLYA
jgi:hypothetical protein